MQETPGSIPGLGRHPKEGNSCPLQYSGLEFFTYVVHAVTKSQTQLSDFHFERNIGNNQFSSVQFSHSVVPHSLQPHGLQHFRLSCPLPTPGACSNSCPLSWWCHPTISSSVIPFSSCFQSFLASRSFPMSQLFTSSG